MSNLDDRLGRSALISFTTNPAGVPATLDPDASPGYLTYALQGGGTRPGVGEVVHLFSEAGQWSTRVRAVTPGALVLERPAWLSRRQERQAVRVSASAQVTLQAGGARLAGRIDDLSVTGAAIVVEAQLAPPVGSRLTFRLPAGTCEGIVRSRRPHPHPLLRVLGTQWTGSGAEVRGWLEREVQRQLRPHVPSRRAG
jgi:PilZ domain-containing protein